MVRFKVYQDFLLNQDHLDALTLLYQPILSYPAISLYLTLHSHARYDVYVSQRELLKALHVDEQTLTLYRQELEQFGLIQSYEEDVLEMVLNPVLSPSEFLAHQLYSRLFVIVEGHHRFAYYCDLFRLRKPQNLSREITQKFDVARVSSWDLTSEQQYHDAIDQELSQYSFNAKAFFNDWALFPKELVSPDVLKLVAEYGSKHKVSIADMKVMLLEVEKHSPKVFDFKFFAQRIAAKHGVQSAASVDNIYDLEPVSFLAHLQQFEVSHVDKATIENLKKRYDFENSVFNLLIETMLKNGNAINYSYAVSIADPWVRQGVNSYESAKAALQEFETRVSGKAIKASGVRSSAVQPQFNDEDDLASQDALEAFKRNLNMKQEMEDSNEL